MSELDQCYQACGLLEQRIIELRKINARMQAHMLAYPNLYLTREAPKWVEEMFRLIEQAEKLQKEEGNHVQTHRV